MKNKILIGLIACATIVLVACKEEFIGQYPIDNIPPQPVSNVKVENLNGAVEITYDLPDETDLLYVKAEYTIGTGELRTTKTSAYSNKMYIKGFGKKESQTIKLYAVDSSQNESEAVETEINPDDAVIYSIIETVETEVKVGGFRITWENPTREDIVVEVVMQTDVAGESYQHIETFYSTEALADKAVYGLDSIENIYGVFIRDAYFNRTDTSTFKMKPKFEEVIPKSGFKEIKLSSQFKQHTAFGGPMSEMWDGITNVRENCFYIMQPTDFPYFTMDLGVKAKLSRFRIWQRIDFIFALHNPREFEWWGTNNSALAQDNENVNWKNNPEWTLLVDCESKRPSGGQAGDPVTAEDEAYVRAGEEFNFSDEVPIVRYLRFQLKSTWGGSKALHINELSFWGIVKKDEVSE